MGKYYGGILGSISGKVGSVSGYSANRKAIIRKAENSRKVNNFGKQVSVKGFKDLLGVSFSLFLPQWFTNIYDYLDDSEDFNKEALIKAINYVRHKGVGIYDCESLFKTNLPYLSGYTATYNGDTGVLVQTITSMELSLGAINPYGILDANFGMSGAWAINQGYSQAGQDRVLTRNIIAAGAPQFVYIQSLITNYGTPDIALCPPKVIRVY